MADEQIVTSIVAKADLSSLVAEVHKATASLQQLQQGLQSAGKTVASQVKVINNSFGETLRSTGQFATHFVTLHSDVEKFGKGLDSGRLKLRDYYSAFNQHAKTSGGLIRDLAKQQVMLQNAVMQPIGRNAQGLMQYNVHIPRGLDLVKNKTNLARMELQIMNRAINEGATALINWGKNTQWAGRQLTVGLTLPIAAFGSAAAKAFREADQELTRLAKVYGDIGGATSEELAQVRKDVVGMSKELSSAMGVNFKETISLAADIAATGKTGTELMGSLRETTRLAVLGEVDRAEAMKATLAIQTAFKQNTDELSQSINFLNAVENQTSTTLNDLVTAIPKAGPVIKQLGGSVQDLALYMTAMREGGINASEGANALKSGLASLINPTKQTVGVMSDFGIDILGMVQKNAGNTTSLLYDLQSALDQLDPLQKAQAIEQMFGKFQFARISALLANLGKEGSQTQQVLQLMGATVSELEQVAGRELAAVTESASGQYRRAIEGLKAELSTLGEDFLGLGTKFVNVVTKLLKFLNNLPEPVKKLITAFGGLTAVAGPIIMLTGVLANFAGYLLKGSTNLKALLSGSKGWKMLTPEIVAADYAARNIKDTFYSDAQAAKVLEQALRNLVDEFNVLNSAVTTGNISVKPAISTMANNLVMTGTPGREVDPFNKLVGDKDTRAFSHINPRKSGYAGQLLGVVPGALPVNRKIGAVPQMYMTERLPNIEGLTSVGGASTGIVAQEAAKFHALMATLGMQTEAEVAELKKVIALGGTVSSDLLNTYDDLLPITSKFAMKAANESSLIVAELRAAKITVEEAKLRIMTLNAQIEAEMSAEVTQFAAMRGRTIDFSKAPLMDQPVTDASGQYTLRDLFKRGSTKGVMEEFGRLRGVRTYGAPYSIETTRLPKFNTGGQVYTSPNIVPGPDVNADVVPAMLTPGEFVVNRESTRRNLPLLMAINNGMGSRGPGFNIGGMQSAQNLLSARLRNVDYDEDLRIRTIMHDAAVINRLGFSADEAIDIAEKNYKQAYMYSLDRSMPGGMDVNPDLWAEIRNQQLQDFDELSFRRTGRRAIVQPTNNNRGVRSTQGIKPTAELIRAMRSRGGQFSAVTLNNVIKDVSRVLSGGRLAYESEHTLPYSSWQNKGVGNLFQAIAGSRDVNLASSNLSRSSRGAIPNIVPLSRKSAQLHWNSLAQFIALMSRKPVAAANSGGMIPGYNRGGSAARSSYLYRRSLAEGNLRPTVLPKSYLLKSLGAKFGTRAGGKGYEITGLPLNPNLSMFEDLGLTPQGQKVLYNELVERIVSMSPQTLDRNVKKGFGKHDIDSLWGSTVGFLKLDRLTDPNDKLIIQNLAKLSGTMQSGMPDAVVGQLFGKRRLNRGGMVMGYNRGGGVARRGRLFYGQNQPAYLSAADIASRVPLTTQPRSRGIYAESFMTGLRGKSSSAPMDPMKFMMSSQGIAMGGSMAGMAMMGSNPGLGIGVMTAANIIPFMLPGIMKFTAGLKNAETRTAMLSKAMMNLGKLARFGMWGAAIGGAIFAFNKWRESVANARREVTLLNGMTVEGAKQAGIKYNDLSTSIEEINEQLKAQRALGKANFDAMSPGNIPGISMTVKDMKEAKKFAKENLKEFVDTFNTVSADQVVPLAQNIKAQFIAGGMSAEEATKKIYGIVAASEKANQAISVLGSAGFTLIYDKASAAEFMVKNLVKNLNEYTKSEDLGNAFSNTLSTIDGIRKGLIGTKDEAGNVLTETEALSQAMEKIEAINGSDKEIGATKLAQLKQSQPELAAILNSTDTIAGAYAKWQVAISGARVNLQKMSSEQAIMLAKFDAAMSSAMENMANAGGSSNTFGLIGDNLKKLDKIAKSTSAAAQRSAQKTQEQYQEELKLIDKKIKKINEEADAKRRALQTIQDKENYQLELQRLQLEYQDAIARGDMPAAARAQLNIQQLQKEKQITEAINAIEDERERKIKKQEAEKERIQDAMNAKQKQFQNQQNTAADAAAVRDELAKQQAAYETLIKAVANAEAMPADTLKQNTRRQNAINQAVGNLGSFTNEIRKLATTGNAMQQKAFAETFADLLKSPPRVSGSSGSVINGQYIAGPNIASVGEGVKRDVKSVLSEAQAITGGKTLADLYTLIKNGGKESSGKEYGKNNPFILKGKYDTKQDGTLTDEARGQIVDRLKLEKDQFFKYGNQLYRVTGSNMNTARAYLVKKAAGGMIYGPGTGTSDSIPAMLSNGEYVINAASVRAIGTPLLDRINGMANGGMVRYDIPKYSTGGRIMYNQGGSASSSNALYNINVTLNGTNLSPDDVAKAIHKEMKIRDAASGIGRRI